MRRAALAVLVGAAAAAAWLLWPRADFRLPTRITLEEMVADLIADFERAAVAGDGVRVGGLQPSYDYNVNGGYRRAIIAPPPALVRFRLHVPAGAVLRFGAGIDSEEKRDPEAAGVRFAVTVDGRPLFSRDVNPAARRHDRRWFDEAVEVGTAAEREVELALRTEVTGTGTHLAGFPGWSHVRLVRRTERERQPASPQAPSVLVLLVDALRADRLGCYGATPSPSPTLDRLAAEGLVFENAVAQSSWTLPSVTTVLTGLHPRSHGVLGGPREWGAPAGLDENAQWAFLSDSVRTLAQEARSAGITTVAVSGNPLISRGTNLASGFETFVEFAWNRERRNWPRAEDINTPFLRWLEANRNRRFLAYLHYMEPHDPYTPPQELRPAPPTGVRAEIAAGYVDKIWKQINWSGGAMMLSPVEIDYLKQLYDAEIRAWDHALAELVTALRHLGLERSTVLVVTADHGEEFQEHGRLNHGSHLYEESIHVPLVIAGPSVDRGRILEQAQGIDIFPTVAALLDMSPPADLPGQNLLGRREARPAFSDTRSGIGPDGKAIRLLSVRTIGWKLIHAPALGRYELYALDSDPAERTDRTGAAATDGLARLLAEWEAAAPPVPVVSGRDPALRAKLRALGYAE